MTDKKICGILLHEESYSVLAPAIDPYLQEGRIGKYIYGINAINDGYFLNITVTPELVNGRILDSMEISIPLQHIKFIVRSTTKESLGFI